MLRMTRNLAHKYRRIIAQNAQILNDEEALEVPMLFPRWNGESEELEMGARICYNDTLYKVLQTHTTQPSWTPDASPSLFAQVLIPNPDIIPDWTQPDSTNAYMTGDKVRHNDKIWESAIDNNVWEPGAAGSEALWIEITE